MIYNVFGGTLNLTQSINQSITPTPAVSCLRITVTWTFITL